MVKSRKKSSSKKGSRSQLQKINPHAAGIDLGAREHWVCVPSEASDRNIRSFGCTTPDLLRLADWLEESQVTSVALESTGVEWIPLFQILKESSGIFGQCQNGEKRARTQK